MRVINLAISLFGILFYPYNVLVNKCSGSCDTSNNPMAKLCVPGIVKRVNMQVYIFLMMLNETRSVLWHESCKCVCKLNSSVCNKSVRNKDIISVLDTVGGSIENKIEDKINPISNNYPNIKIKDYDKFRFNSDTNLPLDTLIDFRSIVINVSCIIEKDNEYYPEIYLDECLYVKGNVWPTTT